MGVVLGNKLAFYRKKAGLTQVQFGSICGWGSPQSRVGNYENSRRNPCVRDVHIIIRALNANGVSCSFEDLFPLSDSLVVDDKAA